MSEPQQASEKWFAEHNKPWWARRHTPPMPRKLKIYWWVCVVVCVLAFTFLPLLLLALPMMLVLLIWHVGWMVQVRRG